MYQYIIKRLLFLLNPEKAHYFTFDFLKTILSFPGLEKIIKMLFQVRNQALEREVFGITFPNPVGLAAGFDKDAKLFNELDCFGFGFIEIGTVTPKAQPGNPKPRLYRIPEDNGLINRMGFNNEGVEAMVRRLKKRKKNIIIGGNIGKNKTTPNEQAFRDYEICFEALFSYVDYFVVNVSSPNTPNLRELQEKEPLTRLLQHLQELNSKKQNQKPILLKIAPDLSNEQLDDIIDIVKQTRISGLIATNTTIDRSNLKTNSQRIEDIGQGGVSGSPARERSTEVIRYIAEQSNQSIPIIGVGGIHSPEDAIEKLNAGASLIQVYTGFIYEGPSLIRKINKALLSKIGA